MYAMLPNANPFIILKSVRNSSFLNINVCDGPGFVMHGKVHYAEFRLPYQYCNLNVAGPKKSKNISNCSGSNPVEYLVFALSFRVASADMDVSTITASVPLLSP